MLSSVGFGYDAVMISGLLANNAWFKDLQVPSTTVLGAIIAANSFGAVACLFPSAYLSNRFGRKRTIIGGSIVLIGTSIGQALAKNLGGFIGTRVILGFVGTSLNVA
jgi:MFS family permease